MLICRMQKDTEQYFLNANPQVHPILEYVSEIVSQTGTNSRELDLFGLSLSTVRDWCREAAWNCPTETGVIHIPNLTEFIDQIPNDYHWWMTDDISECFVQVCGGQITIYMYIYSYGSTPRPGIGIRIHQCCCV